eukprot:Sdes_comp17311_c0_seq1m6517
MEEPLSISECGRRVKVYALNEEYAWVDKGTGFVTCAFVKEMGGLALVVRSEVDGSLLLESKILMDDIYQRQQDTLIVWNEPDGKQDLALSFEQLECCNDIWDKLCSYQGRVSSYSTMDVTDTSREADLSQTQEIQSAIELPQCSLQELNSIAAFFSSIPSFNRERVGMAIVKENYISQLVELFRLCEDMEDTESLHLLFTIIKSVFLLNEAFLFDILFRDDICMDIIGILEYDESLKDKQTHRVFLQEKAKFKQIIPFNNEEIISKIHQNFRVQYVKDVILPRLLDDATFSSLNSFIFFNNVEIVTQLQKDQKFLSSLFSSFLNPSLSLEETRDLVLFLQEFCLLAKSLQMGSRTSFYNSLCDHGLLAVLRNIFSHQDLLVRTAASDIFSSLLLHDPSLIRSFILLEVQKSQEKLIVVLIVEQLIVEPDSGMQAQFADIIRNLLDVVNINSESVTEKSDFLTLFYSKCVDLLASPFFNPKSRFEADLLSNLKEPDSSLLYHLIELFSFFVQHHSYHIRSFVVESKLIGKILHLLRSPHKFIALAALRFFRTVVGENNPQYDHHIIECHYFDEVTRALVENGKVYNLFNSAIIELFQYIQKKDRATFQLLHHVCSRHRSVLEAADYVSTFKSLLELYDAQSAEQATQQSISSVDSDLCLPTLSRYRS